MEQENEKIIIVKGRLKAQANNLFGQFIIIFNNDKKLIESFHGVISSYSDLFEFEPHNSWDKYQEKITDAKWKGNYNLNMTNALNDLIKNLATDKNFTSLLFDNAFNYDYENLEANLSDLMNRIIHDKTLLLESTIQEITPDEYRDVINQRNKPKEEAEPAKMGNDYNLEEDAVILPVKAILSPVKGKPIFELKIGDKIMVKILSVSDRANYYIDSFNLREDDKIRPLPAEVIDIKSGKGKNDPVEILTLIEEGLYGKIVEDEKQVKLRIFNPAVDTMDIKTIKPSMRPGIQPHKQKAGFSRGTITMIVVLGVILAVFVTLILLSW